MRERSAVMRERGKKHSLMGMLVLVTLGVIVLEAALGIDINWFLVMLGAAFATFAKKGATWAWIPAGVLLFEPATKVIGGVFGASDVPSVSLPLLVMAGGTVLVFKHRMPPGVARACLVGLLILTVLNLGDLGDRQRDRVVNRNRGVNNNINNGPKSSVRGIGTANLVVDSDEGDVTIVISESPTYGDIEGADVTVIGDQVVVHNDDNDITLPVRRGTNITVNTHDGDVEAELEGGIITINTGEGDVTLDLIGDPDVNLTTSDGDIDLKGYAGDDDPERFAHTGSDQGRVIVNTGDGDIDLTRTHAGANTDPTTPPKPTTPTTTGLR